MSELMQRSNEMTTRAATAGGQGTTESHRPWHWLWQRRASKPFPDRTVRAECRCRNAYGELPEEAKEVVLDVRDLPLHGQIGRTLEQMEELPAGARLRLVNSFIPWSLFPMLETRGYRYRLLGRRQGDVHILIWSLDNV